MAENNPAGRRGRVSSGSATSNMPQTNPAEPRRSLSSGRNLMFVDSTADQARSREAIRVHVMRESHRVRRLQQGQSEPSSNVGQLHMWSVDGSYNADNSRVSPNQHMSHELERTPRLPNDYEEPRVGPSALISTLPAISDPAHQSEEFPAYRRQLETSQTSAAVEESERHSENTGHHVEFLVGVCRLTPCPPLRPPSLSST